MSALGLWRRPAFRALWIGATVSAFGTQVTRLALPLTAVLVLDAGAAEMGLLGASRYVPVLLIGLVAGAWVDRVRRRPVMIGTDLARATLVSAVPVAWALGVLRLELLLVVAFGMGVLAVLYDVAFGSYVPSLLTREELVEGNSKFELGGLTADSAGPGLGGALVQLVTAPVALVVDAASYVVSAVCVAIVGVAEPPPSAAARPSIMRQVREGFGVIWSSGVLRAVTACHTAGNFLARFGEAVFLLYLTREVGLTPAAIGLLFAAGTPFAMLATLVAQRMGGALPLGRTMIGGSTLLTAGRVVIAAAVVWPGAALPLLFLSQALTGLGSTPYEVGQVSIRQAVPPSHLQGRVTASYRFVAQGAAVAGALVGGLVGESLGAGTALGVAALFSVAPTTILVLSPLRHVRGIAELAARAAAAASGGLAAGAAPAHARLPESAAPAAVAGR